ncbi:hypothetical protein QLX08_000249 [Tetragonisca angustula]|uniref:Secreted protein n=1 Tax=Tetragonisca angustula TaxID=166442 RepID=A0AAW1AM86_9HYME
MYFRFGWWTVLIGRIGTGAVGAKSNLEEEGKAAEGKQPRLVSWVKIDGHQRPWAASRLEQGIAPPRRPRSGGATAAPQIPTLRRRRSSGRTIIRTCRRYPCEAVPHYFVIVPLGVFRGIPD